MVSRHDNVLCEASTLLCAQSLSPALIMLGLPSVDDAVRSHCSDAQGWIRRSVLYVNAHGVERGARAGLPALWRTRLG